METKKIWVVYEDCHGDVSYWDSKELAYEEARNIIMQDPYHPATGYKVCKEDITDLEIEDYDFCVGVKEQDLNVSWR